MTLFLRSLATICLCSLVGCTHVAEIRTHHGVGSSNLKVRDIDELNPHAGCGYASSTDPLLANSIEEYKTDGVNPKTAFWAGYVEFDDEGWLYKSKGQADQIKVLETRLKADLEDSSLEQTDFIVVAFIHGWHHNAHDMDCNVHEFRAMLKVANTRYEEIFKDGGPQRPLRVVGVYVGWRGESVNITGLRYTTVFDRRNAAERVAKGDVRELFALLRRIQFAEEKKRSGRMRTIVLGHSYGGLIAFHGLSPAILNELTLTKPEGNGECKAVAVRDSGVLRRSPDSSSKGPNLVYQVFPDMLTLINPAFEGTRFEVLHELMRPSGCSYPKRRPKVVVVTADNDSATGWIFTAERKAVTLLEAYPAEDEPGHASKEREANSKAIGFVNRYLTHRLCLKPAADGQSAAVASFMPHRGGDWDSPDRYAPVWVVRAPPEIVDGHNGFLYAKADPSKTTQNPYLLNWLITVHSGGVSETSSAMTGDNECPEEKPPH